MRANVQRARIGAVRRPGSAANRSSFISRCAALGVLFLFLDQLLLDTTGDTTFIGFGVYSLHLVDVGVVLLGASLLGTLTRKMVFSVGLLPILAISIIYAVDVARAFYLDPIQALFAMRERLSLLLLGFIVLLRGAENPENKLENFTGVIVASFCAFVGLFGLRLIFGANLFLQGKGLIVAGFNELRALTSYSTIFLACCALLFLQWAIYPRNAKEGRLYGILAAVGLIVVLLTRQRTATVATVAALVVYLVAAPGALRRLPRSVTLGAAAIIIALLTLTFFVGADTIFDKLLPESFQHAAEKRSTLDFRKALWASAISDVSGRDTVSLLFGPPMGTLPNLVANGLEWHGSLHSFYVETIFDTGVFGVFSLIGMYAYACFSFLRIKLQGLPGNGFGIPAPVGIAWIVALLVYGYSYDIRPVLDLMLVALLVPAVSGRQRYSREPGSGSRVRGYALR